MSDYNDLMLQQIGGEGFGYTERDQLAMLTKALEANEGITDIDGMTDFQSLQVQSLETTLAMLTATDKKLTLWRDIPKGSASSTIEEYAAQFGHGQDNGGWVQQMENPEEADPQFSREFSVIKYNRQMWKFSDVAGMVKTITPAETKSKQSASMRAMRAYARSLYSGDADLVAESIDGFQKVIENNGSSDHVFDMRGSNPTKRNFDDAAELIIANFGNVEGIGLYCSPGGISAINQIAATNFRQEQTQFGSKGEYSIGGKVTAIDTPWGSIVPKNDIFLAGEYEGKGVPKIQNPANPKVLIEGATNASAPGTPSLAIAIDAPTVTGSLWAATGTRPAGTYGYRVAAGNRFGLSAACAEETAAVAAAGALTLTITAGTGTTTYYEIYSEAVAGSGEYRLLKRIPKTGATDDYQDLNEDIPGTTRMFLLDLTTVGEERTFLLKRLAPMFSQEFARIGHYRWGTVSLYATPQYYAPLRFVMFKNVPVNIASVSDYLNI